MGSPMGRSHEVTLLGLGLPPHRKYSALLVLPARADAVDQVGDRGVAVAERAVGVLRAARHLHRRRQQHGLERRDVGRAGRVAQHRRGHVGARPGDQVVVDLHDDPAARLERLAEPGALTDSLPPGAHAPEPGRAVEAVVVAQPGAAEAGPALTGRGVVHRLGLGHLFGRGGEQDDVVDDVGVARLDERAGQVDVVASAGGRAGSSGSRRCRCPWGRGRVRGGHLQRHPLLALAQRLGLGRAAGMAVAAPSTAGPSRCRSCRRSPRAWARSSSW